MKLKESSVATTLCMKISKQQSKELFLYGEKKWFSDKGNNVSKKSQFLSRKLDDFISWYEHFTGMDQVHEAQNRVLEDEQKFRKAQESRRNVSHRVKELQIKIKEIFNELEVTSKGDDRYIRLVTEEHKLLKEEKTVLEEFAMAEKVERDSFAALSTSVKLSHEKERAQAERTKYWSIIGSIMGTVIGIIGTSFNNHLKMNELKELVKNSSEQILSGNLQNNVNMNESLLKDNLMKYKLYEKSNDRIEELLNKVFKRLGSVELSLQKIVRNNEGLNLNGTGVTKNYMVGSVEDLVEMERNQNKEMKNLLYALACFTIIIPICSKFS